MKKPELLAPAGDFERMKWAFMYGADAVYLGGPAFGLRANAINFTMDELKEAVEYAHSINKKIYVTVNIILHNEEAEKVSEYLKKLEKIKVDAIIVSDPYILEVAKEKTNLEVHISTQASITNYKSAQFLKERGATRIILARELSEKEITTIIDKVDIEIETFIHGAMCASISGRCVLSNYLTNRDANRGGCSQICRWSFDLYSNEKISDELDFSLCTKDLIMVDYVKDLIEIGVSSLKIEGRMRSIYYLATVISIYRKVIDGYFENKNYEISKKDRDALYRVANREQVPQFFIESDMKNYQYYNNRKEVSNQDFLGVVLDYNNDLAFIEQRNYFEIGEEVEIMSPNNEIIELKISEIYDENMEEISVVRHPLQRVYIKTQNILKKNSIMRKKIWQKSHNIVSFWKSDLLETRGEINGTGKKDFFN